MIHDMTQIPNIVERLIWPGMIFWFSTPFQDHATSLVVTGICEVMGKSIPDVVDVVLVLSQMEVT